jgi:hypothetical protein
MVEELKAAMGRVGYGRKTREFAVDKTGGEDKVDFVQQAESLPRQNESPCVQ